MIIDSHTPQSESNISKNKSSYDVYSNVDDTSLLLYNNRTYTTYLPNIIIGLSTFYILVLCTNFYLKQQRRYIHKLQRKEKQRLREKWKRLINQDNETIYDNHNHKSMSIERPETVYNKKCSHSYPNSTPSFTLNHTLTSPPETVAQSHINPADSYLFELTHPNQSELTLTDPIGNKEEYYYYHHHLSEKTKRKKRDLFKNNYYWKMRKNKRLDLLWQWSVSMGYCQYEHGKMIEERIIKLKTKQSVYYKNSLV